MKQSYKNAIEHGGDQISAALGKVERLLTRVPNDQRGLAYKGALLTMISQDLPEPHRGIYRRNGVILMQQVLDKLENDKPWYLEVLFVTVTTLLRLAPIEPMVEISQNLLEELVEHPALSDLTNFEAVGALVMAAELSKKRGDSQLAAKYQSRARNLDAGLANQLKLTAAAV